MATLANMRADVRSILVEASAQFYTDAEINRWLNYGYKNFIARTEWTERIKAYPVVANQFIYTAASDLIKVNMIRWKDQYFVQHKDMDEFARYAGFSDQTSDRPTVYQLWPDGNIRIYPIPSAASASSTVSGAHNSSVTTIALADASSFPSRGRIILNDSEQVLYYAKSGNNLTQCVRGDGQSTAASYVGAETAKYAPLEVYMSYMPADLSADGDTTRLGPNYDEALVHYATFRALQKRDKYKEAQAHKDEYESIANLAVNERKKVQLDRLYYIKEEDSSME